MEDKEQERNVIVISDDDSNKKPWALSLASFGFYLKKFKYWILGATLIGGIIGFGVIQYVYNPSRANFQIGFAYQKNNFLSRVDASGNTVYSYSNGTVFDYQSIVSEDNMRSVIEASNQAAQDEYRQNNPNATEEQVQAVRGPFANIDYERIANENLLTITPITNNASVDDSTYLAYDINGFNSDFLNDDIAREFVSALIRSGQVGTLTDDFAPDASLAGFNSITYPYERLITQVQLLQDELDFLFSSYTSLENVFGSNSTVSVDSSGTTMTLDEAFRNFKTAMAMSPTALDTSFSSVATVKANLSYEVTDQANQTPTYIFADVDDTSFTKASFLDYYNSKITALKDSITEWTRERVTEQTNYDQISETLKNATANSLSTEERALLNNRLIESNNRLRVFDNQITQAQTQIADVTPQLNFINSITDLNAWRRGEEDPTHHAQYLAAKQSINDEYNKLINQASIFRTIYNSAYLQISTTSSRSVKFLYRDIMVTNGTIAWYIGALTGILVGFILGATVSTIYGQAERRRDILMDKPDPILPKKDTVRSAKQKDLN